MNQYIDVLSPMISDDSERWLANRCFGEAETISDRAHDVTYGDQRGAGNAGCDTGGSDGGGGNCGSGCDSGGCGCY